MVPKRCDTREATIKAAYALIVAIRSRWKVNGTFAMGFRWRNLHDRV